MLWNLFVSIRSLCLLTPGYQGAKERLHNTLADLSFRITDLSVNRIDYAIDILAPDFVLDVQNFIMPGQAKARPFWSKERELDDDGYRPKAVIRGRKFESVTIGTMPNRQVIVYDKRRAAIDQRQPHWFEAWNVDKDDPGAQVWRVEIRGGRDALAKRHLKRSYEAIEHDLSDFLTMATTNIRYVTNKDRQKNVSRAATHPIWEAVAEAIAIFPVSPQSTLPEAHVLKMIREQRGQMALKLGVGNLLNHFILEGTPTDQITADLDDLAGRAAATYRRESGERCFQQKIGETEKRLVFLKQ